MSWIKAKIDEYILYLNAHPEEKKAAVLFWVLALFLLCFWFALEVYENCVGGCVWLS